MINEYSGSSGNDPRIFKHLVGETIEGVFTLDGSLLIVLRGGEALVLRNHPMSQHVPNFALFGEGEVTKMMELRRAELAPEVAEFEAMSKLTGGEP